MNKRYITASEIADYVYCKKGWWLKVNGKLSINKAMENGIDKHNELRALVHESKLNTFIAIMFMIIGFILMIIIVILHIRFGL